MRSSSLVTVKQHWATALALFFCVLFVISGSLWIWRPGIQSDEALFTVGMYPPFYYPPISAARIFGRDYALMVMSYVGSLKTHLWMPIFAAWGGTPMTIRFPALIVGAVSVWLFFLLVRRTLGVRAALIGVALLATDSLYLFTVRWDWGPVALQHLMLVGGLYALTRRWIGLAFFLFGLGMWDKALFIWSLVGMGAAGLVLFHREIRAELRLKTLIVATLAFLAGAYPLIRYNVKHDWVTFRGNAVRGDESLLDKAQVLRYSFDSTYLGAPILRDWWDGRQNEPTTALERGTEGFSKLFGSPHRNAHFWLMVAGILALPLIWRTPARRAILFALIFMTVVWTQMAWAKNGGTSIHHTVLLWPMPILIIAAAGSQLRARIAAVLTSLVVIWNLAVTASWYTDLNRFGAQPPWTDAVYQVTEALQNSPKARVCALEWGFFDNIRALSDGKVEVCVAEDPVTEEGKKYTLAQMSQPGIVYIAHTQGNHIEKERVERIQNFAKEQGFRMTDVRKFADSNGRENVLMYSLSK
jgi:hypothetical protein